MPATPIVVALLIAFCALAVLALQGFFYSRRIGLFWLALMLLGSALAATMEFRSSPLWLAGAAITALVGLVAALFLVQVIARNIRNPAMYIPLAVFLLAAVAAGAGWLVFAAAAP